MRDRGEGEREERRGERGRREREGRGALVESFNTTAVSDCLDKLLAHHV